MIRIAMRSEGEPVAGSAPHRRRFGLDTPLPADPQVIERAVLRVLAERCPSILVVPIKPTPDTGQPNGKVDLAAGVPDLLLLLPEGRLAWLKLKPQAQRLTRAQNAFADLCRERAIPFHVVRSANEARQVLARLLPEHHTHG